MPRMCVIDSYYPDAIKAMPFDSDSTYDWQLRSIMDYTAFGTADFYSRNLKALGWECADLISNHHELQAMWAREHDVADGGILFAQIHDFKPDVVFMQDLSILPWQLLKEIKDSGLLLAGQCSCPMTKVVNVKQFQVLFTSFPHYVRTFAELGVKGVFNPLAFESSILDRVEDSERIYDCVFVGGVGSPSHWTRGMETLNAVAHEIPTFKWWGYGLETLPKDSPLREKYQGEAFGLDMYEILSKAKIALNRHGEVSQGYANNMKLFETTGMKALLLTEAQRNLGDYFEPADEVATYESPADAVQKIRYYLEHEDERAAIAARGHLRTMKDHTYTQRMVTVSDTLKGMLS